MVDGCCLNLLSAVILPQNFFYATRCKARLAYTTALIAPSATCTHYDIQRSKVAPERNSSKGNPMGIVSLPFLIMSNEDIF
jgi:hypothetical protein